jgi:hypothetical protein
MEYLFVETESPPTRIREKWLETTHITTTRRLSSAARAGLTAGTTLLGFSYARWVLRLNGRGQLIAGFTSGGLFYLVAPLLTTSGALTVITDHKLRIEEALAETAVPSPAQIESYAEEARRVAEGLGDPVARQLWIKWIDLVKNRWLLWQKRPLAQLDSQAMAGAEPSRARIAYELLMGRFVLFFEELMKQSNEQPDRRLATSMEGVRAAEEFFTGATTLPRSKEEGELWISARLRNLVRMLGETGGAEFLAKALEADCWHQFIARARAFVV